MKAKFTYLVGPTYLIEIGSFRFLSDPGFDPEGTEKSEGPGHELKKNMAPPLAVEEVGKIDAVFVSHAHHFDNLDNSGKAWLPKWGRILTDKNSAELLRGHVDADALATWQSTELSNKQGERIIVTAMPAVHTNNEDIRGAVGETTGFLLEWEGQQDGGLLITGDSVWIKDYEEIEKRYKVGTGILHMGAANVPAVGDNRLTMNGAEGARLTELLNLKNVFPAHFEGPFRAIHDIEAVLGMNEPDGTDHDDDYDQGAHPGKNFFAECARNQHYAGSQFRKRQHSDHGSRHAHHRSFDRQFGRAVVKEGGG